MLSLALDNFRLVVVDVDIQRIVRLFTGHTNTITDMVGIYTAHDQYTVVVLGISWVIPQWSSVLVVFGILLVIPYCWPIVVIVEIFSVTS